VTAPEGVEPQGELPGTEWLVIGVQVGGQDDDLLYERSSWRDRPAVVVQVSGNFL